MSESPDVSDEAILAVFARTDETSLRPPELAEDLPLDAEDLRDRVENLSEQDLLELHEDRQSGTTYSLTAEGQSRAETAEGVVTDVEAQATAADATSRPHDQETPETPPAEPGEASVRPPYELPDSAVESFDPPGTPEQKDRRRRALRAACEYLAERGRATRADLVSDVYPDAPGAFEDPEDWWTEVVEPGLASIPGPQRTGDGGWTYDEVAAREGGA